MPHVSKGWPAYYLVMRSVLGYVLVYIYMNIPLWCSWQDQI